MDTQENTQIVQQAYARFKSGDIPSVLSLMTDDVVWVVPEVENMPFTGKRQGRQQVAQFFADLADDQDVLDFTPEKFVAQEDCVIAQGHYTWRVKATGREYTAEFAHFFTVHDGKVVLFREYADTTAMAAAHQTA